ESESKARRALQEYEADINRALARFSWFIYRVNRPAIRALFMARGNPPLRMREAVLSLLAGDVFRPSPIHASLRLFKAVYYAKACAARCERFVARFAYREAANSGKA